VCREGLDYLLILVRRHVEASPGEYAIHYNRNRPHRALALADREPSLVEPGTAAPCVVGIA
jgi:hypothetical protein